MRLGLVILAVTDLGRARAFYERALGFAVTVEVPVYVEMRDTEGMRLGLYVKDGFARNTGRVASLAPKPATNPAEVYFLTDDAEAALTRALEAGAELLSAVAPRDWGDTVGYARDPDGHVLAFAQPS